MAPPEPGWRTFASFILFFALPSGKTENLFICTFVSK